MDPDARTRFFCSCGRLLVADGSVSELVCPTCQRHVSLPDAAPATSATGPSSSTQRLSPQIGGMVDHYRIGPALGSGGMGAVYRAVDQRSGQEVALKLLHPSLQARPDFVSRFRREARAASGLQHPNVVRVLGYGLDPTGPWIAMELLEGQDLLRVPDLDETRLIELMKQTASGLKAAAAKGITHRDIKPTNLILLPSGQLKIADFGLAKGADTDSHLTLTGEVLGTPHYMSPEQGRGHAVDFRSDLYSLGATFYHLAARQPPFTADTPVAVIMKHVSEEPAPLHRLCSTISPGFEAVIHRLLQKKPAERYASYDHLLEDLRRLEAGREPRHGIAPPESVVRDGGTTYVMPREARTELLLRPAGAMRRALALGLDLALLELLFLAIGTLWSALIARGEDIPPFWTSWYGVPTTLDPLLAVVVLAVPVLYFVASDSRGGRSFGKSRLRLRVCRRDGADAGPIAAVLRVALALPGLLLLSPSMTSALFSLGGLELAADSALGSGEPNAKLRLLGLAYLGALSTLGWLSGVGAPVHDALSGTRVWRAQSALSARRRTSLQRTPSPSTAFWLSFFPGAGLFYAGQIGLGLLALLALPSLMVQESGRTMVFAWLLSAVLAAYFAHKRARNQQDEQGADPDRTKILRRQES